MSGKLDDWAYDSDDDVRMWLLDFGVHFELKLKS